MIKSPAFINDGQDKVPGWAFLLFAVLTAGLFFILFYDEFHQRKYMVNRRRLLRYIEEGDARLTGARALFADRDIKEYRFDIGQETYFLWRWKDGRVSLHSEERKDIIGLFTGSYFASRLVGKIVRELDRIHGLDEPEFGYWD